MSREKLRAREKVASKMTRDGLVERNAVTGEDIRVSRRETELDLRGNLSERGTLSQVGTRSKPKPRAKSGDTRGTQNEMPSSDTLAAPQPRIVPETAPDAIPSIAREPPDKPAKPAKLQFTQDEKVPQKDNKSVSAAQRRFDRANSKLTDAKRNLPTKRNLHFEKEVKTQGEHLKGALPLRSVKAAGNAAIAHGHRKLYQAEHENVGTEAAHKGETIAEGGIRSAMRHHKTAPYRKVTKLEQSASKTSAKLSHQKALAENPKLTGNVFARYAQKRKIKRDYAKKARETKKAAERAKKASSAVESAGKAAVNTVRRHPVGTAIALILSLLIFSMLSMCGLAGGMGGGGLSGIIAASYLATDADIEKAELDYTKWETDLQIQIANTKTDRPNYDEYRYFVGNISHDPFALMAYLTAEYDDFEGVDITAVLRELFGEQYVLSYSEITESSITNRSIPRRCRYAITRSLLRFGCGSENGFGAGGGFDCGTT
ncbi:MAG: hypothetical protein LBN02_00470 [Oscillospiraceae bacterium]|jgi:hypothetical protein|nr:hypothetical protein [Oscillospiraceae bacterium]